MMIAELVDDIDLRERFEALGIDLPPDADCARCCRTALDAFQAGTAPGLPALIQELMQDPALLLPAVRQAIEQELLPHI